MTTDRIVRPAEEQQITGLSRSQLYRLERAGQLPPRRTLTPQGRARGRLMSELLDWMNSRTTTPSCHTNVIGKGRPGPGRPRKQPAQAA